MRREKSHKGKKREKKRKKENATGVKTTTVFSQQAGEKNVRVLHYRAVTKSFRDEFTIVYGPIWNVKTV